MCVVVGCVWVSVGECVGECECVWVGGEEIGGRKEKREKRGGLKRRVCVESTLNESICVY